MYRFVDDNDRSRIDLGDGDWVEIPAKISFEMAQTFEKLSKEGSPDESLELLKKLILGWNLKGKDGQEMLITPENLNRLDLPTYQLISDEIIKRLSVPKKELTALG